MKTRTAFSCCTRFFCFWMGGRGGADGREMPRSIFRGRAVCDAFCLSAKRYDVSGRTVGDATFSV